MKKIKYTTINKKLKNIIKFIFLFFIFMTPLYFISRNIYFLQLATAKLVFSLLKIFRFRVTLDGVNILIAGKTGFFLGDIAWDCTGWKSIILFISLVMASPKPLRMKVKALIFVPVIYIVNIFRIFFMFVLASENIRYFQIFHQFLWSFGMVAIVFLLWLNWFYPCFYSRLIKKANVKKIG
ncbi:MAG: exosortase/archaeosortase family protein [Candidatus Aenigmarchaeota archaeon]|nr:exosortase/archaeosortase family protein [Candidatus Aenigmarchaeota archaeon]